MVAQMLELIACDMTFQESWMIIPISSIPTVIRTEFHNCTFVSAGIICEKSLLLLLITLQHYILLLDSLITPSIFYIFSSQKYFLTKRVFEISL